MQEAASDALGLYLLQPRHQMEFLALRLAVRNLFFMIRYVTAHRSPCVSLAPAFPAIDRLSIDPAFTSLPDFFQDGHQAKDTPGIVSKKTWAFNSIHAEGSFFAIWPLALAIASNPLIL